VKDAWSRGGSEEKCGYSWECAAYDDEMDCDINSNDEELGKGLDPINNATKKQPPGKRWTKEDISWVIRQLGSGLELRAKWTETMNPLAGYFSHWDTQNERLEEKEIPKTNVWRIKVFKVCLFRVWFLKPTSHVAGQIFGGIEQSSRARGRLSQEELGVGRLFQ